MTGTPTQVQYPVIILDRDPAVYVCNDPVELEALFEPAFEEEFFAGFDMLGRKLSVDFDNHTFRGVHLESIQADMSELRQIVSMVDWLSRVSSAPAATASEYVRLVLDEINRIGG